MRNKAPQENLFETKSIYDDEWRGMPEYVHDDLHPYSSVTVHFESLADRSAFSKLVEQPISDLTKSLWYPGSIRNDFSHTRYLTNKSVSTRYPIYIISKGRADTRHTSKALERLGGTYRIVIEPQELEQYAAVIDRRKILVLPFSNLGQGSIPVRNWVWEHSTREGHKRHWILDDNISGFCRFNRNKKVPVGDMTIFAIAEDFADRYENVGMSGFNYRFFAEARNDRLPPYFFNTRIYSCILIQNDMPLQWRGRYNEDTDLSIRALKLGYCTILYNSFLCDKKATMTMKGGNTDELYADDGRLKMAQSLKDQHPELVEITEKWGRYQHHVDYRPFKKNKLVLKPGVEIADGINDYGMELKTITEE